MLIMPIYHGVYDPQSPVPKKHRCGMIALSRGINRVPLSKTADNAEI